MAAWVRGEDVDANDAGAKLLSPYSQSAWVYIAVSVLAENVAQIPFRISQVPAEAKQKLKQLRRISDPRARNWRKKILGENIIDSGAVVDLFEDPHPTTNRALFWESVMTYYSLRGEFFILPLDQYDQPVDLDQRKPKISRMLTLEPLMFWHRVLGYGLDGWRYTGSPLMSPLPSEYLLPTEVIHSRSVNPFLYWRGMSPLLLAMLPAQADYAIEQFMKGLMMNNADTGVIVTTDQQPDEKQRAEIMAALRERKRKAGTPDRPLFLWGGSKVEKPTLSLADSQVLETRKFNRQEIGAIFKVPEAMMGFSEERSTSLSGGGNAINADRLTFIEHTLTGHCRKLEAAVDPIVESFDPTYEGWFDVDSLPIMQESRMSRVTTAVSFFGIGVPFNDVNEVLDLGFRELPWGNKGYLPFSLQEVGDGEKVIEAAPPSDPNAPNPNAPVDPNADPNAQTDAFSRASNFLQSLIAAPPAHVCAPNPEYDASMKGSIRIKKGKLSRFFFEQRGRVLASLEQEIKKSQRSFDDIFNAAAEDLKLLATMKPLLIADLQFGGAQLWKEIGLDNFNLPPNAAIDFLNAREPKIVDINATTWDSVKAEIQQGLAGGESYNDIADRVKSVYQDATDRRADVIALTETNTAINGGRHEAMVEADVPRKGWQTSHLENTRATHLANESFSKENNGIPIDDTWPNGLLYPGDPDGDAGETINCRCFGYAIIAGKAVRAARLLRFEEFMESQKS